MSYVLGIDGGLLRTYCVIADTDGRILGLGKAGGSDLIGHDPDHARENLLEAVVQAQAAAGLAEAKYEAACLGISGFPALGIQELAEEMLSSVVDTAKPRVEADSDIALYGATAGGPGIVVLAGAGSVAYGMNQAGEQKRAGGWGHIIGDEGSLYWIGLSTLRALARSQDQILPKTVLTNEVFKLLNVTRMHELVEIVYQSGLTKSDILEIAPITIQAAKEKDSVAIDIITRAADCLTSITWSVIRRLNMLDESFPLAVSGKVFDIGPLLMEPFREKIAQIAPKAEITEPKLDPVIGAVLLALQSIQVQPKEELIVKSWNEVVESSRSVAKS